MYKRKNFTLRKKMDNLISLVKNFSKNIPAIFAEFMTNFSCLKVKNT